MVKPKSQVLLNSFSYLFVMSYSITRAVSDFFVVLNSLPKTYQTSVINYVGNVASDNIVQSMQQMLGTVKETVAVDEIPSLLDNISSAISDLPVIISQASIQSPELVPLIIGTYYGTQYLKGALPKIINTLSSSINPVPSMVKQSTYTINTSPQISTSSTNTSNNTRTSGSNTTLLNQTIQA